ncbi:RES family NAD+ phosphorylase [Leisingera sp. ANG-DT]|uniref:RES family NAD+ phosphorylase n=1 Tax=Leisingera sp. ANG-DT TaxID=1577897 RepID=UPI003159A66F
MGAGGLTPAAGLLNFSGTVWRILFRSQADRPLAPARAPEGRFHHSGQLALYTSLSAEGAGIAIRRYVSSDDPPRIILPLQVKDIRLADLRGRPEVSAVWQDIRARGTPSPTWVFSDTARTEGAQGLLYSSRSRPDLTHLVLFGSGLPVLSLAGPPAPWLSPPATGH